jgi:hypothetical protein
MQIGVRLGGFTRVMIGVAMMRVSEMGVMGGRLVTGVVAVLGGFAMMFRGLIVVVGGGFVMFGGEFGVRHCILLMNGLNGVTMVAAIHDNGAKDL